MSDDDLLDTLEKLSQNIITSCARVPEESRGVAHYRVYRVTISDETGYVVDVIHDTIGKNEGVVKFRDCESYMVVSCVRSVVTGSIETTIVGVVGRSAKEPTNLVDDLVRITCLSCWNATHMKPMNCKNPAYTEDKMLCTYGIQPMATTPSVHMWLDTPTAPRSGREIISRSLHDLIARSVSDTRPDVILHDLTDVLPVYLKHQWRPLEKRPSSKYAIPQCQSFIQLLRSSNIVSQDAMALCMIDVTDGKSFVKVDGTYYGPAPVDLQVGDYIRVHDRTYVYSTPEPLEDKRFMYLPTFVWSGNDCPSDSFVCKLFGLA